MNNYTWHDTAILNPVYAAIGICGWIEPALAANAIVAMVRGTWYVDFCRPAVLV